MSTKWKVPVIAVDIAYAKPIALCGLTVNGKIGLMLDVKPSKDIYHTVNEVIDKIIPYGAKTLVICETPLIINNMNSAYMLTRFHAMLEKGIRDAGQVFFGIHPLTWQKAMLNPQEGDNRKKLSIIEAQKYCSAAGWEIDFNNDEADALNIARFALANRKRIMEAVKGGVKFSEKSAP